MALIVHQTNGYSALTVKSHPWSRVVKLRCLIDFKVVGRTNRIASLKHHFQFRGKPIVLPKEKPFKVSSFKGNGQSDGEDEIDRDYKFSKKPVQLSHAPHHRDGTVKASPNVPSDSLSYACCNSREGIVGGSQSIERLFNKWLNILHARTSDVSIDEIYNRRLIGSETSETQEAILRSKAANVLKAAFLWFMGLDATIKIPFLIFVPWCLMTRVVYGIEVTKELTPLWVLGPLVAAFYIKIVQGICFLYIFCFNQAIRFVEHVPSYHRITYSSVMEGKLKAFLNACFCQPIVDVKIMDYKALVREKLKEWKEWALEKYLDYVESIWPYYCRTIRFLKKANLL